jgi:hypothetical protein
MEIEYPEVYYFICSNLLLYGLQIVLELFFMCFTSLQMMKISRRVSGFVFAAHVFVTGYGIKYVWTDKYNDMMNTKQREMDNMYVYDGQYDTTVQWLIWLRLWHIAAITLIVIFIMGYICLRYVRGEDVDTNHVRRAGHLGRIPGVKKFLNSIGRKYEEKDGEE